MHYEGKQYGIGSVVFHVDGKYVPLMGEARVNMLALAYNRQLPEGTTMHADYYHQSVPLKWEDVQWNNDYHRWDKGGV